MNKYELLKEFLDASMKTENERLIDGKKYIGVNNVGMGMCMGALEAYNNVLEYIKELEKEVGTPND